LKPKSGKSSASTEEKQGGAGAEEGKYKPKTHKKRKKISLSKQAILDFESMKKDDLPVQP
jgi:hypothetical protein